uniref:SAM-dependent methyltransferase n=1 Tax=Cystobacter fuscus TaxID=43 RepID=A0A3S7UY67_9BACT|nr:SAM-dependent methyltransferase [Cystobacter fuscus]
MSKPGTHAAAHTPVPEAEREDFSAITRLYDVEMAANATIHDLVFPLVFGAKEYVGQFSDNSASELLDMGRAMELPREARVLDIGCGRGAVARLMASTLGWRMTGIDLSEVSLQNARTSRVEGNATPLTLLHGNVYETSFPERFHGAYGTGAFCHFDATRLFARCRQLLLPGGKLAFMERVRLGNISPADWKRLTTDWHCPFVYTPEEYRSLLEAQGFTVLVSRELTSTFRVWQRKSIEVRQQLKREIVERTSLEYFETSLRFAAYENDVTEAGLLGYVLIVARRGEDGS